MSFISEDKRTINLPVPLGTTVYRINTDCNDACLLQKEVFNKVFLPENRPAEGWCSSDMPCHTKMHSIRPVVLSMTNLEEILETFGNKTFETYEQAKFAGEKLIEIHKQQLSGLGLKYKIRHLRIIRHKGKGVVSIKNIEVLEALTNYAKGYIKDGKESVLRNRHMNELKQDDNITQVQVEAVVTDFINYIGAKCCIDLALYTSDLK